MVLWRNAGKMKKMKLSPQIFQAAYDSMAPAMLALSGHTIESLHETVFSSLADQHHHPLDHTLDSLRGKGGEK